MPPPCFLSPPCQSGTWTVITPIHRAQRNHHLILLPPGRCRPSIRGLSSQTLSDSKGLHPRPVLGTDDVDTFTQGPRLLLLYRSTRCASQNPEAQLKVQPEPRSGPPPPGPSREMRPSSRGSLRSGHRRRLPRLQGRSPAPAHSAHLPTFPTQKTQDLNNHSPPPTHTPLHKN